MHNRTASSESGCNLPCSQHKGRIPWGDNADWTNRFSQGVVRVLWLKQGETVLSFGRLVSEEPKIGGTPYGSLLHEADRLTTIRRFHQRNFLGPLFNKVGEVVQNLFAGLA